MQRKFKNVHLTIGAVTIVCFGQMAVVGCSSHRSNPSPGAVVKQAPNTQQEMGMIQSIQFNQRLSQSDKDAQISVLQQQFQQQANAAAASAKP